MPDGGIYATWNAWYTNNTLPYSGGSEDQPLMIMNKMRAISTVYSAYRTERNPEEGLSALDPTQEAAHQWLEQALADG